MQEKNISTFNLEQCLKCGICVDVCPMLEVNPAYKGPKQSGPDGERYRLKAPVFYDEALKYCLNCKRCEVACPSGVQVGDIIQAAKLKYGKREHVLRNNMLGGTDFVGPLASAFAPIVNPIIHTKAAAAAMDCVLKIDHRRVFPSYSSEKFESWFRKHAQASQASYKRQVSYFHGCYVNYNYPQLGKDLVKVLNAVGIGVNLLEKEKCCGIALISGGNVKAATKKAVNNIASIRAAGMPVVTTSSTCTFTMRDEYPHLLGLDNADIRDSIALATRYLWNLYEAGEIRFAFRQDYRKKAVYHTACHMQKLGWGIYSTSLLGLIPGLDMKILRDNCCGISGTYGFKKENYEYSQQVGSKLFDRIAMADPEVVVTDCETCKWQIEMSTGYPVQNPISILADALDVEKTKEING